MTSTERRSAWARLRSLFGRPESTLFAPVTVDLPELLAVHRGSTVSFETPAKGGGFTFQVEVRCDWCAEGRLDEAALSSGIDRYQASMAERISYRVRDIARLYEPFHVEEAECAVNDALREGECFENGLVTCTTVAHLQPAPEVLDKQREASLELQEIEHKYAKSELQVRLLREASEKWQDFLAEGLIGERADDDTMSWLTPWAVLLAEQPDRAATEVGDMFQQRQNQVDRFVKLLGRQRKEYESQDLYEFVIANEQQLGHAMRLFGLPLPGDLPPGGGMPEPLPRRPAAG